MILLKRLELIENEKEVRLGKTMVSESAINVIAENSDKMAGVKNDVRSKNITINRLVLITGHNAAETNGLSEKFKIN
jgi:hypothetical protein